MNYRISIQEYFLFQLQLLLVALGGAAPPLQLETRAPAPPIVLEETVIVTDPLAGPEHQTTENPTKSLPAVTVTPQEDFEEIILTAATETPLEVEATVSPSSSTTKITVTTPPANSITPAPRLSGKEREALINHLNNVDLATIEKLVLSPRQKLALTQELEYKRLGLPAFSDPTPWQKLTRDEQRQFNEKYLALRTELQDYSKVQFTSLPEERQEHAYRMFLHLDIDTLTQVINRELERQQEAQSLFENESLANDLDEIVLSENPTQELSQNLFTKTPETFQDSINIQTYVKPQKLVIRFDNSQENNLLEIAKPQQKFQISEQQLDQLQQQLDQLEESG